MRYFYVIVGHKAAHLQKIQPGPHMSFGYVTEHRARDRFQFLVYC